MATSIDDISALLDERRSSKSEVVAIMRDIKNANNGRLVVPLPEMDKNEVPAIANLINIGIDETGMRMASTTPNLEFPPLRPGVKVSQDKADARMRASLGWWSVNDMNLIMRKRARHFVGYSQSPVYLKPRKDWGCSEWNIMDPLDTYPSESNNIVQMVPDDCIFLHTKNLGWLKKRYPDVFDQLLKYKEGNKPSDQVDIVEYVDANETVLFAQSRVQYDSLRPFLFTGSRLVPMTRVPNRTNMVPVVIPERINLDHPLGQFDGQIGMYRQEARLTALNIIAIERNIFPDTYLIGRQGMTPKIVNGPYDGRTGKINVISGGDIEVKTIQTTQSTDMAIDRLERAQRANGKTPADMTGESASNVRTGKRGDAIMSATIDMNIQEGQEILASSMQKELKIAIAQAKSYFGNEKKSFYISGYKSKGDVVYTANDVFENDNATVTYPYAGTDANSFVVAVTQRKGAGMLSNRTAMELDPMVGDVDAELALIDSEAANQLLIASFSQQAQQGLIPPADVAAVAQMVQDQTHTYAEAILAQHKIMQERQATPAPSPTAPEAQPGMANPGTGAEQPAPAPSAPAGPANFLQAISSLTGKPNATLKTVS